jgi:spore coat protein A
VGNLALGTPLPPSAKPFLDGNRTPANANEMGPKDTVMASPGEVTDVLAYVNPAAVGQTNVLHCHILEHEEKDMMMCYKGVR